MNRARSILQWRSASLLALLLAGCGPANPGLERLEDAGPVELGAVVIEAMTGSRRGAETEATGVFSHGDDRMTVTMAFVLGPPARLVLGDHVSRIGGESVRGSVFAESVTFLGGQNTGPSVGGVFILNDEEGGASYRLRFPPTLLAR